MNDIKVLLIEDDATAREQLAKFIRKEDFEVLVAEDGKMGIELFNKESPDIVITDVKMPCVDGLEVMRTLRKQSKDVQIILITAFGETDTVITAIREGAIDYIKKPIDLDHLSLTLGRARENVSRIKDSPPYPTLLLVEDEDNTRNRLASMLEKEDWKVLQAGDGEEAINLFQETKVDVAILDIKMPKKDGIQSLHEMRNISEDFEAIILTGYGDEKNAIQALRDGALNFLKKPIDVEQLILTVGKALEKINLDRALKYRTRELELAKKIIAQITMENEIIIDSRKGTQSQIKEFANKLLDVIPLGLIVIDKDMKMLYTNSRLTNIIDYQSDTFDETFLKRLKRIGIKDLLYDSLVTTINNLIDSPSGSLVNLSAGKYSFVSLIPMTILGDSNKETVVLMALRGERQ